MDEVGQPVDLRLDCANRHDLYACGKLADNLPPDSILVADRGYDSKQFRNRLKRKQIKAKIRKRSWKKPGKGDPIKRWGRWKVERTFAWFGKFRKLETRYEYYATRWTAFWYLGSAMLLLKNLTG